ncbi:MAG TPA: 1-deoxy-D-xylulose-5-phosphate synthase [Aliicoccus persicus]|uniref:1-deoxy-D-xylulose-5-phosphate synthase n=1 Tax=Aliicoccus persicus TaxID=930138 RepID=A0A921B598_9STAP|nr:1-deoxy-D-xylulose-5-phosphate synthase [Aliicoccus persicus]
MNIHEITNPDFLKDMNTEQLERLSADIRAFLIESCSKTGGHIGANLGVVELTIALHKHFNSPEDKILFDVGHQAYIHKILTGRINEFDTLRQYKGLCGFPKMRESEHDVWEAGHSSTSLSAAMGMALARDIKKEDHYVVPIIGDGALTGGMALEALNNIGSERTPMIIILNDNEMSIAPNVGAMHNMLGRIRSNVNYNRAKYDFEEMIENVPQVGSKLRDIVDRLKDSFKYLFVEGVFFEELGIKYLGPVDGHDYEELDTALQNAKDFKGPVLVHVVTKKGKGYTHAETDEIGTWHGLGPYKIETGEVLGGRSTISWSEFVSNTVLSHAHEDERIVAITPAMPVGSKLTNFARTYPERFFDVGIAEQHAITMSAGLAAAGMKPYLAIYSTFLQRGYDQLLHDVDRQNLNVFIGIDRSGLVGADGETHQGIFDISFITPLPNMVLMMPKDELEASQMIELAFNHEGPIALRYPRGNVNGIDEAITYPALELGRWENLTEGDALTIVSFGPTLELVQDVADAFKKVNININVVNARFIKPMDESMLHELGQKNQPILVVEESMLEGGLGSMIGSFMLDNNYKNSIERIGIGNEYIEHGNVNELLDDIGISFDNIYAKAKEMVNQDNEEN